MRQGTRCCHLMLLAVVLLSGCNATLRPTEADATRWRSSWKGEPLGVAVGPRWAQLVDSAAWDTGDGGYYTLYYPSHAVTPRIFSGRSGEAWHIELVSSRLTPSKSYEPEAEYLVVCQLTGPKTDVTLTGTGHGRTDGSLTRATFLAVDQAVCSLGDQARGIMQGQTAP